ncbi:MAG: hypothetical protein LBD48_04830 [Treponema sp.]|jgi:hypothetical protein|nr:hypothetical protein [Treponema sp.]
MPVPDLLTKIQSLVAAAADFCRALFEKVTRAGLVKKACEGARGLFEKLLERIPEERRRLILLCAGGGLALMLLVFAGASLVARRGAAQSVPPAGANPPARAVIPPDEVFLPEEPDFVPGVLLERQRRSGWTAADAAPWWQDPLKNGEEQWREQVEKAIDNLLERVP